MSQPACDFCMGHYPRWEYPCADHTMTPLATATEHLSTGSWLACQVCADLIDTGAYTALAAHSLHHFFARHPDQVLTPGQAINLVLEAQGGFDNHRQGDKVAWG